MHALVDILLLNKQIKQKSSKTKYKETQKQSYYCHDYC